MPEVSKEVVREIGQEIGNVILSGVNKRLDKFEEDFPKVAKQVVDDRFRDLGVDPDDVFTRRQEFQFLKDLKKDWEELSPALKAMVREFEDKKASDKAAKQAVKNRLYVGAAVVIIAAVLAYVFHVDLGSLITK